MTEIKINFNKEKIGFCTEEMINGLFPNHPRMFGVKEGFCSIAKDPLDSSENALLIKYPKGIIQEQKTRIYFKFESAESATLTYKVFFPEGFDFVRGGKLPGLYGGTAPRGGKGVAVEDGFSIRTMWRELGSLCSYIYYMDMNKEKKNGENFLWTNAENKNMPIKKDMWETMNEYFNDRMYISTGKWLTLKTYVKMNTPGQKDGKIICWLDEKEVVNVDLIFRKDLSFGIDTFAFTTFFGGSDPTWVPSKDEVAYFKDFTIVLNEKVLSKSQDIIKIIEPTEEVFKTVDFYIELVQNVIPESKITLIGSLAIPTCTKNEMGLMVEIEPNQDINKILEQVTNNSDDRFYSGTVVDNEGFVRSKKKYGIRCELHILHKDDERVGRYLEQVKRFKSDTELTKRYETLKRSMNGKTEAEYKEAKNTFFKENNF